MPYTYYIFHRPTNQHYYGARWARDSTPDDLMVTYFTSSKVVHDLIGRYGVDSFDVHIRRHFTSSSACRLWEHRVLKRLRVWERPNWINISTGTPPVFRGSRVGQGLGRSLSDQHRMAISNGATGVRRSEQSRHNISMAAKKRPIIYGISESTRQKRSTSLRRVAPQYTFCRENETWVGCLADWCDRYTYNRKSAASNFSKSGQHAGWSRSPIT